MTPDELRILPGGSGPIPSNGSWGGSPINCYPPGFIHPGVGNPEYIPERNSTYLFSFSIALAVFTSIVVAIRISSRVALRATGADDWLIIAATLATIAVTITICLEFVEGGAGKHWYDISYAEYERNQYLIMPIHGAIYTTAIALIKLSILFFFRRLFENTSKWMSRLIIAYIIININFFVICAFCLTIITTSFALLYSLGGIHLLLEISILILPVRMIWRLRLPLSQKIMAVFILGLGGVVCVISGFRLWFFTVWIPGMDQSFNGPQIFLYAILECTLGILASSAPSMKAAYIHYTKTRTKPSSGPTGGLGVSMNSRSDEWSQSEIIVADRAYIHDEEEVNSYRELIVKIHTATKLGYCCGLHDLESGRSGQGR